MIARSAHLWSAPPLRACHLCLSLPPRVGHRCLSLPPRVCPPGAVSVTCVCPPGLVSVPPAPCLSLLSANHSLSPPVPVLVIHLIIIKHNKMYYTWNNNITFHDFNKDYRYKRLYRYIHIMIFCSIISAVSCREESRLIQPWCHNVHIYTTLLHGDQVLQEGVVSISSPFSHQCLSAVSLARLHSIWSKKEKNVK